MRVRKLESDSSVLCSDNCTECARSTPSSTATQWMMV